MKQKFFDFFISFLIALSGIFILITANLISRSIYDIPMFLPVQSGIFGILYLTLTFMTLKIIIEKFLKKALKEYFIRKSKISTEILILSFLLPLAVIMFFLFLDGEFIKNYESYNKMFVLILSDALEMGIGVVIVEELIFRAYFLKTFEFYFDKWTAVFISSFLFAGIHILFSQNSIVETILFFISVFSVGILLCLISYKNKSIIPAVFFHFVWNMLLCGYFLHIGPEHGKYYILSYKISEKSVFITGGSHGAESSLVSIVFFILAIFYIIITSKKGHNENYQI